MCGSNDNLPVFAGRRMQTQGPGTGRTAENAPQERQRGTERDYNRSTQFVDSLLNIFNPQKAGEQTTTQQNLPSWAIPDAMSTLGVGNYYTQNPDYRPSTLDRDYSGLRGYDQMGRPNSQVGQFGLNPTGYTNPLLADPINNSNTQRQSNQSPNLDNLVAQLPPDMQGGGLNLGRRPGTGLKFADGWSPESSRGSGSSPGVGIADRVGANILANDAQRQEMLRQREGNGTTQSPQGFRGRPGTGLKFADEMPANGRGMGRSTGWEWDDGGNTGYSGSEEATSSSSSGYGDSTQGSSSSSSSSSESDNYYSSDTYDGTFTDTTSGDSPYDEYDSGYDITSPPAVDGGLNFSSEDSWIWGSGNSGNNENTSSSSDSSSSNTSGNTGTTTTTQPEIVPKDIFNPDDLTPFSAYDRQRFAAPGQNTLRGEGILAGRYDQRFGPGGTDPFAAANQAVGTAANYTSGFQGTMGEGGLGGQAGNYQQGLGSATDPNVFQSGNYTSGLPNFANPNANQTNVNSAVGNVNARLQANTFSNANANLTGAQNYNRNFQDLVNQSNNPYQDQVVNQTIADLNRARQMTQNQIGGQAAKAGAFGGSRQALLEAENNRNYLDRVAAATGQLRQQGFESAANRAQQENLQRLGLTASDTQNVRGLQSQGNLAAQGLTARDKQDVRGLQSQGALAAQGLQSQGGLAAQGLQSQGALAALGANANLYGQGLGLGAGMDRAVLQANAGLLSDAMGLDASDLRQRRDIASNEAQFQENALRGAGALNLQGGNALANLAQYQTADERQRITDLLRGAAGQDMRNQQDLDFIRSEFDRELQFPSQQIDLRNRAISPATNSVVTQTQDVYGRSPLSNIAALAALYYGAA